MKTIAATMTAACGLMLMTATPALAQHSGHSGGGYHGGGGAAAFHGGGYHGGGSRGYHGGGYHGGGQYRGGWHGRGDWYGGYGGWYGYPVGFDLGWDDAYYADPAYGYDDPYFGEYGGCPPVWNGYGYVPGCY